MVNPIDNLQSLKILSNFSSCNDINDAEIIIGRVLECPRDAYAKCLGKGIKSSSRGWITDGMFTLIVEFCSCMGSTWLQSSLVVYTSNKATILASSSSSSLELSKFKACFKLSDDWSFSCVLATTPWIILTTKYSSIDYRDFIAIKMWIPPTCHWISSLTKGLSY